jgi:uncharacterized sulfatase
MRPTNCSARRSVHTVHRVHTVHLLFATALLTAANTATALPAAERPERHNILWISLEDTSPDLGCYGDSYAVTPNIDRLASQGVRFNLAFSHSGVCAPTRSGIITGMYPTTIGTHHMRCEGVPPAYVRCFTEYLRAAGYYCTNDSKTDYNFAAPRTAWDDNRNGAHWRNRPDPKQPFFAVINLTTTHESRIRQSEEDYRNMAAQLDADELHDPDAAPLPPYYPDTPVVRRDWARYHDCITFTDKRVGQILQDLEDDGLAKSTIVFFWGDHGRGLPRAKRWVYDSGIHVPLIVRWPGHVEPGTTSDELVCFLDLAPTVLSLAGVPVPEKLQGQVILGPEKAPPREYIFAARDRMDETYDIIRAVRDKRFKYIRNYRPELPYAQHIEYMDLMPTMQEWRRLAAEGSLEGAPAIFFQPEKPREELYDTVADPHEIANLVDDAKYAEVLERLRAVHEIWMRDTGDLGLIPEDELWERVRPGGEWSVTDNPFVRNRDDGKAEITCATEGASIAYCLGTKHADGRAHWLLYTGPIALPRDADAALRAQSFRLGYRDSAIVEFKP